MIKPSALRPGARVALVAPAGPLAPEAVERAEGRVRELGWEPATSPHARDRHGFLSSADAHRLADLQAALDSTEVDGIWCLRGGYGTMRIMHRLDLRPLRERPRPLIGFSDNTVLHLLATREGVISFHGPHPATEGFTTFSLGRLAAAVTGETGEFPLPPDATRPERLTGGCVAGRLTGGNLALLAATLGTRARLAAEGAILAIEDVGEPLYRIDRMLTQLRLAGALEGVAGIALGAFNRRPDEDDQALPTLVDVLGDRLGDLGIPVAHGFPFGHVEDSWTLPIGARVSLDADAGSLTLIEPAVES